MYRILLADDEPVIIRGLKKMIDWKRLNAEVVGEAENGEELLKLIETAKPDIIVSDIAMPNKTGLDVIRTVSEKELNIKIIFLTGFQEFSYAKSAITYGAVDYLLKPVRKEELEKSILQAEKMLKKEAFPEDLWGETEEDGIQSIFNNMNSGYGAEDFYKQFQEIGIETQEKLFVGACFTISRESANIFEGSSKFELLKFSIFKRIQEYLKKQKAGLVIKRGDQRSNVIFILSKEKARTELEKYLTDILDLVQEEYKIKLNAGIGEIVEHVSKLQYTYKTAKFASELHFFHAEQILRSENISREFKNSFEDYNCAYKRFVQSVMNKEENWLDSFEECLNVIEKLHYGNRYAAENRCIVLAMDFFRELKECSLVDGSDESTQEEYEKAVEELRSQDTYQELKKIFTDYISSFVDNMYESQNGVDKMVIREVKDYIQENFAQDISLNQIARMVYMNPYYLSTYFKKETGQNFKDYVTEVRMKEALKLLQETDIRTYELAKAVGYKDVRSFTEKFRKTYGDSPSGYKKK